MVFASRYRKLLEAAKDVDDFTRFVVAKYAELHHHLHLNHDNDDVDDVVDDVERAEKQSFCDHDFLSRPEQTLTDCQQHQLDDVRCTRHGIPSSYQQQPSSDGLSFSSS